MKEKKSEMGYRDDFILCISLLNTSYWC